MNREIKFRLWNSCGNHSMMFYKADQVIECLKQQIEFNNNEPLALGYNHEGDGSSFMQYIGLTDKHGIQIYEGDILTSFELIIEIIYLGNSFVGKYHGAQKDLWSLLENKNYLQWEKVGNIYEHPHLLT